MLNISIGGIDMKKVFKILKSVLAATLAAVILFVGLICYVWFGVLRPYYNVPNDNKFVAEYDVDSKLVPDDALEIFSKKDIYALGVNADGKVVFQHPRKAFEEAESSCRAAKKYEKKAFDLKHMSKTWYLAYIDAGAKVQEDKNASDEVKAQAVELSYVLAVYNNSFNKAR